MSIEPLIADAPPEEEPQPLTPEDLPLKDRKAGKRWIIGDGILAYTMGTMQSGVFLTGFALMLGASETAIGLLGGLPRIAALMQPAGSYFVERFNIRKSISVWIFGPARFLWLLILLLPLFGYTGGESRKALILLFAVATLSTLLAGFASVSWLAWMSDLIPEKERGRYFGKRSMISGAISALIGYLAGLFLDAWKSKNGQDDPHGFLIVFGVGLACGMISWYCLTRCPEPPIAGAQTPVPWEGFLPMVREAWQDLNFRQFLYFSAVVSFGVWMAGPFFSVYMIKYMHLPYGLMGVFMAVSSAGSLLFVRFFGRLADHFGNRPVLWACINGVSLSPILWLLSAGGSWWPILIGHFIGGMAWSGYFLTQMNLVFKITPSERKSVYIAMYYALDAAPSLLAPLLGGLFLQHMSDWKLEVGSWTFVNYHWLFLASGLTRFLASPILRKVKEPRAKRLRHMIRVLSHIRTINPILGTQYYVDVFYKSASHQTKRAARRAARALKKAARALKKNGSDHPSGPPGKE